MAGAQISTSVTILSSLLGYQGISLTNFATSAVSQIAAGSKVEVAGAFFTFTSAQTITGWSSISDDATAYIICTPSGTAGSQILTPSWSSTVPVWSTSKQGWYVTSGSNVRVVGSVNRISASQSSVKTVFPSNQYPYPPALNAGEFGVKIGESLAIATHYYHAIAALSETEIAYIDQSTEELRTYTFDL